MKRCGCEANEGHEGMGRVGWVNVFDGVTLYLHPLIPVRSKAFGALT